MAYVCCPTGKNNSVPVVCWFRRSCCQAPPAGAGFSSPPAAAAVEAAGTAPWVPLDRLAAGAAADPSEKMGYVSQWTSGAASEGQGQGLVSAGPSATEGVKQGVLSPECPHGFLVLITEKQDKARWLCAGRALWWPLADYMLSDQVSLKMLQPERIGLPHSLVTLRA